MREKDYLPDSPYLIDNLIGFEDELQLLYSISRPREYSQGEIIYMEGEESKSEFYLIESGRVKVSITKDDGSEKILAFQEDKTFFGETAALDRHQYFATATVMEPTKIHIVPVEGFLSLARKYPKILFMMLGAFARVVRMLVLQVGDLSFLGAQKRVAHMVYKLVCEIGRKTPKGYAIEKKVTHEDIANLTGLSRVSVSLALNQFEEMDILRKKRHMIEILDVEKLKKFISGEE